MANLTEALGGALSPELLTELTTVVTNAVRDRIYDSAAPNTVASGALGITSRTTFITTSGAQSYSLANGAWEGQRKSIRCTVTNNTGTFTPADPAGYSTITFDAVGEAVELEWHTGGWVVVSAVGATINA